MHVTMSRGKDLFAKNEQNSCQKWVRIIKPVKNLINIKGQPHTYLVQKQYKCLLELNSKHVWTLVYQGPFELNA